MSRTYHSLRLPCASLLPRSRAAHGPAAAFDSNCTENDAADRQRPCFVNRLGEKAGAGKQVDLSETWDSKCCTTWTYSCYSHIIKWQRPCETGESNDVAGSTCQLAGWGMPRRDYRGLQPWPTLPRRGSTDGARGGQDRIGSVDGSWPTGSWFQQRRSTRGTQHESPAACHQHRRRLKIGSSGVTSAGAAANIHYGGAGSCRGAGATADQLGHTAGPCSSSSGTTGRACSCCSKGSSSSNNNNKNAHRIRGDRDTFQGSGGGGSRWEARSSSIGGHRSASSINAGSSSSSSLSSSLPPPLPLPARSSLSGLSWGSYGCRLLPSSYTITRRRLRCPQPQVPPQRAATVDRGDPRGASGKLRSRPADHHLVAQLLRVARASPGCLSRRPGCRRRRPQPLGPSGHPAPRRRHVACHTGVRRRDHRSGAGRGRAGRSSRRTGSGPLPARSAFQEPAHRGGWRPAVYMVA